MNIVVCYDVNTESKEGQRRLRQVAKLCEAYGQRVQWSVFECSLNAAQFEIFISRLAALIAPGQDSLRIYRLHGERTEAVRVLGLDRYVDFRKPLLF